MYLIDTNICIYAMNNKYPWVRKKLISLPSDDIYISTVVVSELHYGAMKSKWSKNNVLRMNEFISSFNIIPFTREDAEVCGEIRAYLEKQGIPIGLYDVMIAPQGIARNFTVITHNVKEFSRVPGLILQDWITEE